MKTQPCEICRGSRIVRLPIYRPVSAQIQDMSAAVAMEATSRDYPCPECGGAVKEDRIAVLDAHAMGESRINDPEFHRHARRTAAHMLIDLLVEGDYIAYERGPIDSMHLRYPVIATLGVVSKGNVASIEARAIERGMQLAQAVADEAVK